MNYHTFNLVRFALALWTVWLPLSFVLNRKKFSWYSIRTRFSWNAIKRWKMEEAVPSAFRAVASFLFYSGLFVMIVALW